MKDLQTDYDWTFPVATRLNDNPDGDDSNSEEEHNRNKFTSTLFEHQLPYCAHLPSQQFAFSLASLVSLYVLHSLLTNSFVRVSWVQTKGTRPIGG